MYALSKEFYGHEQDVKGLATHGDSVFSCSRDGTVRQWDTKGLDSTEVMQYKNHQGFVNSIAICGEHVASAGQDTIINLIKIGDREPEYSLLGHNSNVCALCSGHEDLVISGSWDGTARVWQGGSCISTLDGHEGAVWAVLDTPSGILTGGADRTIRMWQGDRQIKSYTSGKDCIRALALHPLGFVSAGNDATIRVHSFSGDILLELTGHESFIYSLAVTRDGTIYSAGEDRTLRIWKDGKLMQSIYHPAVSVWTVSLLNNGDIVTGASDGVVRVFTKSIDRKASAQVVKDFEASVAAAATPAQSANIPNNLPGLEGLAGPGNKEGEVKMIRTSPDLVEAHQWSGGVWTKIGEVIGASAKKVEHEGKEWDFVFDVDIAEGAPPLKLPYDTDENPYEAADRFIQRNELDVGFQAQIVKFIESNTGGIPLGVPKQPAQNSADPSGTTLSALTPHLDVLTMTSGNLDSILKKFTEFNSGELRLADLGKFDVSRPSGNQIDVLLQAIEKWPPEKWFPALDLLRLCIAASPKEFVLERAVDVVLQVIQHKDQSVNARVRETNIMLSLRSLVNIHANSNGLIIMQNRIESLLDAITSIEYYSNKNLSLALGTYFLNASIAVYRRSSSIDAINMIDPILRLVRGTTDSETRFRSIIAVGTILRISEDVVEAARTIFEACEVIAAINENQEERLRLVISEVQGLLAANSNV